MQNSADIVKSSSFKHPGPMAYTHLFYYVSDYTKKILKSRLSKDQYQRVSVMGIRDMVDDLLIEHKRDPDTSAILIRDTPENHDKIVGYIREYLDRYDIAMVSAFSANKKMVMFCNKAREIIDSLVHDGNIQAILDSVVIKESKPTLDVKIFVPLGLWVHDGVEIDGEVKLLPFNLISYLVKFSVNHLSNRLSEVYPYPYEWRAAGRTASDYIKVWHYEYKSVPAKFKRRANR